jgi:hypothetical protein
MTVFGQMEMNILTSEHKQSIERKKNAINNTFIMIAALWALHSALDIDGGLSFLTSNIFSLYIFPSYLDQKATKARYRYVTFHTSSNATTTHSLQSSEHSLGNSSHNLLPKEG